MSVDGVLWEFLELIECGAVEVEERRSRSRVIEETREACWISSFKIAARLDGCP